MPLLPADFVYARGCKLKCEKFLTRPGVRVVVSDTTNLIDGITGGLQTVIGESI